MNNADLAEIRALLQAAAPAERRPRGPLLGAIRSLLPAQAAEARPPASSPRRVGLRAAEPADIAAVEDLLLTQPVDADASVEARRGAFGQRSGPAGEAAPLLRLAAPARSRPAPDGGEIAPIVRRLSQRLARTAAAVDETPYHPEDMADGGDAERIYADSGLFEPPAAPGDEASDPRRALLLHLERVFVAELAALRPLPDER